MTTILAGAQVGPRGDSGQAAASEMPAGVMVEFGGATAPWGWLLCDGAAISRTTYASLFSAIGTLWGVGNGSTTFNVPDYRGRIGIGAGQGSGLTNRVLAAISGEEAHVLTVNELADHQLYINNSQHQHLLGSMGQGNCAAGGYGNYLYQPSSLTTDWATTAITANNAGSNGSHNNMQPFAAATKIIKT